MGIGWTSIASNSASRSSLTNGAPKAGSTGLGGGEAPARRSAADGRLGVSDRKWAARAICCRRLFGRRPGRGGRFGRGRRLLRQTLVVSLPSRWVQQTRLGQVNAVEQLAPLGQVCSRPNAADFGQRGVGRPGDQFRVRLELLQAEQTVVVGWTPAAFNSQPLGVRVESVCHETIRTVAESMKSKCCSEQFRLLNFAGGLQGRGRAGRRLSTCIPTIAGGRQRRPDSVCFWGGTFGVSAASDV